MSKVKNLLLERRKLISSPTTISDLNQEINNLKDDIHRLKEKNVIIENRLVNIESLKDLGNSSESSSSCEGESNNLDFLKTLNFGNNNKEDFLQSLKAITSQKIYTKITLIIDYNYKKEFTALIDSAADLNCIQEGLILSRYFHKTIHSLISANGSKMGIEYKLPKDKIAILKNHFSVHNCGDHPNAFWNRKKHVVSLPYEDNFIEDNIPTKERPC
ncbi:hypothetical protein H5410_040825 [Solanum commersonii]|uniref:Uncharacterized protein n=1 Tax=Solanum commersonii TaxID=4109 RepID=A0A9J5XRY4_SOLCO|nr:hypothetical protein H5410_040825 [Solanum commersonii]